MFVLANQLTLGFLLHLHPRHGITGGLPCPPGIYMSVRDSNSSPLAFVVEDLPTEQSHQAKEQLFNAGRRDGMHEDRAAWTCIEYLFQN